MRYKELFKWGMETCPIFVCSYLQAFSTDKIKIIKEDVEMVIQVTTKITVKDDDNKIIKSEMHSYMCNPETEPIHRVSLGALKGYEMVRDMVEKVKEEHEI